MLRRDDLLVADIVDFLGDMAHRCVKNKHRMLSPKVENSGYVTNNRSVVDGGFARNEIWRCSR